MSDIGPLPFPPAARCETGRDNKQTGRQGYILPLPLVPPARTVAVAVAVALDINRTGHLLVHLLVPQHLAMRSRNTDPGWIPLFLVFKIIIFLEGIKRSTLSFSITAPKFLV
ncbi:unnamed protein product [Laminaria digitata]